MLRAFRTSQTESLLIMSGIMPLGYRVLELTTIRYLEFKNKKVLQISLYYSCQCYFCNLSWVSLTTELNVSNFQRYYLGIETIRWKFNRLPRQHSPLPILRQPECSQSQMAPYAKMVLAILPLSALIQTKAFALWVPTSPQYNLSSQRPCNPCHPRLDCLNTPTSLSKLRNLFRLQIRTCCFYSIRVH